MWDKITYCDKCYCRDGMIMMAQGNDRIDLARFAIEYYRSNNFSIVYRSTTDHDYDLMICNHNQPERSKREDLCPYHLSRWNMRIPLTQERMCPECDMR